MSDNSFFKPTALYKEFMILDLIEKDAHITQRQMASSIGVAVSLINSYIDEYDLVIFLYNALLEKFYQAYNQDTVFKAAKYLSNYSSRNQY